MLLVEDDPLLAALTSSILSAGGYEVIVAANGPNALSLWLLHRDKISLLFTDMVMPGGITGRELAERLLREKPDLRVVFATGYSVGVMGLQDSMKEGVNLLQKPIRPEVLLRVIRGALDRPIPPGEREL